MSSGDQEWRQLVALLYAGRIDELLVKAKPLVKKIQRPVRCRVSSEPRWPGRGGSMMRKNIFVEASGWRRAWPFHT